MPAVSKKQFRMIQAIRAKYKTKDKAPKKYKWVFEKDFNHLKKNAPEEIEESFKEYLK